MTKINSIYIIDDDAITLFGIKKLLRRTVECNNMYEFKNGKLALNAIMHQIELGQSIPDVIFLDINMPIMDGWEFLNEFLKLPIDKKIIINIVTSSIDPCDKRRWMEYKAITKHYLEFKNKPIFSIDLEDIKRIYLAS
ncbi:response regulator transcription factor [Croceitalea rosinachiae]|uniref:Response regulator n=1 Tax=Croceitalea rosinachiae TaxID=3075596 RepID=A0ABU3ADY1_9FLAO|nr:response regulator [Croceitalea sp. F388]MDT0608394.1 response regulator [Croceitalea sp. F388]